MKAALGWRPGSCGLWEMNRGWTCSSCLSRATLPCSVLSNQRSSWLWRDCSHRLPEPLGLWGFCRRRHRPASRGWESWARSVPPAPWGWAAEKSLRLPSVGLGSCCTPLSQVCPLALWAKTRDYCPGALCLPLQVSPKPSAAA